MIDTDFMLPATATPAQQLLTAQELKILELFFDGKNYSAIAEKMGISRQKVSEIVNSKRFQSEYFQLCQARKDQIMTAQSIIVQECLRVIRENIDEKNALKILECLLRRFES